MKWLEENKKWLIITGIILLVATAVFIYFRYFSGKLSGTAKNISKAAADYVKQFEGYTATAKYDVNAWRIGHGSDTITLDNGTYRTVVEGDVTTEENAKKDLARRIEQEFIPKIKNKIGADVFNKWGEPAQVAMISLAYNYGNITHNAIVEAAKTLDKQKLATAWVNSTYDDNKTLSEGERNALRNRRAAEAQMVLNS